MPHGKSSAMSGLPAPPSCPRLNGRKRVLPLASRVVMETLSSSMAKCTSAPCLKVSSASPAGERSFRYCFSAWRKVVPVDWFLHSMVANGMPFTKRPISIRLSFLMLYFSSSITERILALKSLSSSSLRPEAGLKKA